MIIPDTGDMYMAHYYIKYLLIISSYLDTSPPAADDCTPTITMTLKISNDWYLSPQYKAPGIDSVSHCPVVLINYSGHVWVMGIGFVNLITDS